MKKWRGMIENMKNRAKEYGIAFLSICILVALDQWTKWLAVMNLKGKSPYVLIDGILEFYYFENKGAAFGTMQNKQILFYILTPIILACIVYFYSKLPRKKRFLPFRILSVVLAAGAIGNFIDRIMNQYVIDFIYVVAIDFPIFNVADCYVTISAIALILLYLFYYKEEEIQEIFPAKKERKEEKEV